jgi:hypothetical protein
VPRSCCPGMPWCRTFGASHYELAVEEPASLGVAAAFDELALAICSLGWQRLRRTTRRPDATESRREGVQALLFENG